MNSFQRKPITVFMILFAALLLIILLNSGLSSVSSQDIPPNTTETESIIDPYIEVRSESLTIIHRTYTDGSITDTYQFNGPYSPPEEYAEDIAATIFNGVVINGETVPRYTWVLGCTATAGSMIAAYYDRTSFPNIYTGPTNNGVMPLYDTVWPTWSDGYVTYPNNPLVASHLGVDGRTTRGTIDDYWIRYNSSSPDPYITGGWTEHTWGSSIGDYMKTSQSIYGNKDGSASWTANDNGSKGYCRPRGNLDSNDITSGSKSFYEARGYSVSACYNQYTDNKNSNGFSLAEYKAEIDAGYPVLFTLTSPQEGHAIVGIGYEVNNILFHDTWNTSVHIMPWGGSYLGYSLLGVSIVHPSNVKCYSLNLSTVGSGQLSTTTPWNCYLRYSEGTAVHLVANANMGWHFSHWLGGPTGGPTTDFTINGDANITAVFVQNSIIPTPTLQPTPIASGWNQYFYSDNSLGTRCGSTRNESDIYIFRDSDTGWVPPSGCPGVESPWSVRMERNDAYFQGGYYEFGLFYDDGARLFIDGNLIVDGWIATQHYESHYVSPGNHTLRLDYKNNAGHAIVQLWWRGPGALPWEGQEKDPNQWWAVYWGNQTQWQDAVGRRNEGTGFLNHDWGIGGPGYGIPSDHFSTRYERTVGFECGVYRFHVSSDDGSRLSIDEVIIPAFDHWSTSVWDSYGDVFMTQGNHVLKVDHFENGGGAHIALDWVKVGNCPPSSPGAFRKTSPDLNETGQGTSVLLTWQETFPLTSYEYCYSKNSGCQNWINVGKETYALITGLDYGATYFWQVRALNETASPTVADFGAYWSFSTMPEPIVFRSFLPIVINNNPSIRNGNFEEGYVAWSEYSSNGYTLIMQASGTPVAAHGGSWLAWLGGASSETARLSQTITISGAAPYLHFWYYIASEDACGFDFFRVKVNGSQVYSADLCSSANTNGWVKAVVNLSGMVGASKTVMFEVTTDGSLNSNLFLDDVSMSNLSTMMEEEPVPAEYYPGAALLPK